MQFPMVHLGGTSGQSLYEQYENALHAVREAIQAVEKIDCHGRDYYVISPDAASVAYREHKDRLKRLNDVAFELNAILENVSFQIDQQNERKRRQIEQHNEERV